MDSLEKLGSDITERYEIARDNLGQQTVNFDNKIGKWLPYLKKPVSVLRKGSDLTAFFCKSSPKVSLIFKNTTFLNTIIGFLMFRPRGIFGILVLYGVLRIKSKIKLSNLKINLRK